MRLALVVLLLSSTALAADSLPGVKTQVKTSSKSDVQAQQTGADGTTIANVQTNGTTPGAGGGEQVLIGNVQTSAPTYTTGTLAMPWLSTGGSMHVTVDAQPAGGSTTNITGINGATPSATAPLPVQLTDGAAFLTPAKSSQLPASLGQSTKTGSVSVTLASDQGTLAVSSGALSGIGNARAAPVNISSGGTSTIVCKSSLAVSTPFKLLRARVTGAAMVRCTVRYNDNASITSFADLMLSPSAPNAEVNFPQGAAALTTSATATTQQVEASCTNFDAAAQDVGCDVSYCQSASGC